MDITLITMRVLFICVLASAPIMVFITKPDSPKWLKVAKLIVPVVLFVLYMSSISMRECVLAMDWECFKFKAFFDGVATLQFIMGLGWCELIWRERYKQLHWTLWNNAKYGILSNGVIIISLIMTMLNLYMVFR